MYLKVFVLFGFCQTKHFSTYRYCEKMSVANFRGNLLFFFDCFGVCNASQWRLAIFIESLKVSDSLLIYDSNPSIIAPNAKIVFSNSTHKYIIKRYEISHKNSINKAIKKSFTNYLRWTIIARIEIAPIWQIIPILIWLHQVQSMVCSCYYKLAHLFRIIYPNQTPCA